MGKVRFKLVSLKLQELCLYQLWASSARCFPKLIAAASVSILYATLSAVDAICGVNSVINHRVPLRKAAVKVASVQDRRDEAGASASVQE